MSKSRNRGGWRNPDGTSIYALAPRSTPGVVIAFRCPEPILARIVKHARKHGCDRTRVILRMLDLGLPR